jgi:hypothetical protein
MDRTPVSSTELASVGYDEATSVLEVEFQKGGIYQYFGVPAEVYEQLIAASSKGSYFNQAVKKGGYPFSRT